MCIINIYLIYLAKARRKVLVKFNAAIKNNSLKINNFLVIDQTLYKMNKIIDINEIIVTS